MNKMFTQGIDFPFQIATKFPNQTENQFAAQIATKFPAQIATKFPAQKESDFSISSSDFVLLAAKKAFGITYLFPWQRIVIANILDAAKYFGLDFCTEEQNFDLVSDADFVKTSEIYSGEEGQDEDFLLIKENSHLQATNLPVKAQNPQSISETSQPQAENSSLITENPPSSSENSSLASENPQSISENPPPQEKIPKLPENPPVQEESDSDIKSYGKQIVLLPTGAGKSLCFLTPALILKGPTLVLYPLLALMADQKRRMDEGKIQSVVFRGGQSQEERNENFKKLRQGAKIILANPEVLQNEDLVQKLSECKIAHIAIDEAHVTSEWGDTFRPAYLTLGSIIKKLKVPVVTAFTATASPTVLARISEVLFDGNAHIVRSDSDRPNIHYEVINTFAKKRMAFKLALLRPKPLIIFCGTRKKSEDMARELSAYLGDDKVKFYHAGLEKDEKTAVEKWFYPKTDAILCCTCAFGMGVDKKDIHTVIHLEASPTAESYIQEAGRGGRDGSVATAILLWSRLDSIKYSRFPENSREKVLGVFAQSSTCRRQILLDALGGEKAACDGCDVCKRGGPSPYAEDADFAMKFIKFNRKMFNMNDLNSKLIDAFNKKDFSTFKMNVWENNDTKEILNQLFLEKKIHEESFLWNKKVDIGEKEKFFKLKSKLKTLHLRWLHFDRLSNSNVENTKSTTRNEVSSERATKFQATRNEVSSASTTCRRTRRRIIRVRTRSNVRRRRSGTCSF